ncbi:MAG: sterol desaturase/sphingolipid hydroxylase (fatty acid hydroxylase superfamily) [Parasphingorhabdus sp.]|jgi:sterol desaturase/sphingolipid hydroxylase (fatty acid hydroxylase superfamily)
MIPKSVRIFTGLIGVLIMSTFIVGLAHSISIGFAGFWGGLPFSIITAIVLFMVAYDFWDECIRNRKK